MSTAATYFLRQGSPIIALATAMGGPVAILRISGRDLSIYKSHFSKPLLPGAITYCEVGGIDRAVVLSFQAPHSFTGEDVIEIQCHGVKSLVDALLELFQNAGVQHALPGEFSFRAVMNQKMTLAEAEALNTALSDSSLNLQWSKQLIGFSTLAQESSTALIAGALKKISTARGRVEAAIDYPEAESEQSEEVRAATGLVEESLSSVQALLTSFENFSKHKGTLRLVIAGSPNVGKSTLLNILAGGERALVSDEAGTTRDFVDAALRLRSGHRVTAVDTAGIRFGDSVGKVEAAGVARAMDLMREADALLLVRKAGEPSDRFAGATTASTPVLEITSHADASQAKRPPGHFDFLTESAAVNRYVESWVSQILLKDRPPLEPDFWISARQSSLMASAAASLQEALAALGEDLPIELCGQSLLEAERHLRMSIGEGVSQEYIGEIFSQFCLGK